MNSKRVSEFEKIITNQNLRDYLKAESFSKPTQVQGDCIPVLLAEKDVSVQGRTGSGKTLGYLLPIIQKLKEEEDRSVEDKAAHPKALILLPTRELALQVFGITKSISHFAKLRVRKLVGGDKGKPLDSLLKSQMDILVTTPDRCLRSFKSKELRNDSLKYLIFDEADQLLEPSFKKTVGELTPILSKSDPQVILVSASRPHGFSDTISDFFPGRKFVTIGKGEENILNHKVKTHNIYVEESGKFSYVDSFVRNQKKSNGLIFVGNKARANKVYSELKKEGHNGLYLLHKDLDPKERLKVVKKFRQTGGILIATDVFARGIDIEHLHWVLNFDLPSEPDYYLHRSGRVGRAGRTGDVFNFITSKDGHRQTRINAALVVQGRTDLSLKIKKKKAV